MPTLANTEKQSEKEPETGGPRHVYESDSTLSEWVKWIVMTAIVLMLGIPLFMQMASKATGSG